MVRSHKSGVLVALLTSRTGGMVEDTPASMLSTEQPTAGDTKRRLVKSVLLLHLGATETAPGTMRHGNNLYNSLFKLGKFTGKRVCQQGNPPPKL